MNNDYYYESALAASARGDYKSAIDLYTKAIDLDPYDDQSYNNRGTCFHRIGNHRKAIADFSKAIEINPQKAGSYSNRAGCFCDLGEYENALKDDTNAIKISPDSSTNFNNRGDTHLKCKNYDSAIADFSKAITIRPDYTKAIHNRGIAYLESGNPQEALNDFDKVVTNNPNGEVYKNRGNAHYKLKHYTQAIQDWEKAMRYDSSLKRELKQRIIEVRNELGESSPQVIEDVEYPMSHVYTRLNQVLKASNDGTVNLKHTTIDFLEITKIADYLSDTYTKEKETITRSELAEIVKGIIKPHPSLTDKMYHDMVTILMGTVQQRNPKQTAKAIFGIMIAVLLILLFKNC
jgi:tetratricopeptide (TPR) repeat protein